MKKVKTSIKIFLNIAATANVQTIEIEKHFGDTYYAVARGKIDGVSLKIETRPVKIENAKKFANFAKNKGYKVNTPYGW
jgi:hypothetical protein